MHIEPGQQVEEGPDGVGERIPHTAGRITAHTVRDHLDATGIRRVPVTVGVHTRNKAGHNVFHTGVREAGVGTDNDEDSVLGDDPTLLEHVGDVHRDGGTLRVTVDDDGLIFLVGIVSRLCSRHPFTCPHIDGLVKRARAGQVDREVTDGETERGRVVDDLHLRRTRWWVPEHADPAGPIELVLAVVVGGSGDEDDDVTLARIEIRHPLRLPHLGRLRLVDGRRRIDVREDDRPDLQAVRVGAGAEEQGARRHHDSK